MCGHACMCGVGVTVCGQNAVHVSFWHVAVLWSDEFAFCPILQWNTGCRAGLSSFNALPCFRPRCFLKLKPCAWFSLWFCCFLNFSFLGRVYFPVVNEWLCCVLRSGLTYWWRLLFWLPTFGCHRFKRDLAEALHWPRVPLYPTESLLTTSTPRPLSNPVWWSPTCNLLLLQQQLLLPRPRTSTTRGRRTPSTLRLPLPPLPPPLLTSSILTRPRRHRLATWPQRGTGTPSSSPWPPLPPRELQRLPLPSASINLSSSRQIACSKTKLL